MPRSSENFEIRTALPFRMVIAYEDLVTGQRAMRLFQQLKQQCRGRSGCQHSLWKFKDLDASDPCEAAVEDVAGADIALISTHGSIRLPVEVENWVELWIEKSPGPGALAALLDRRALGWRSPVRDYLQEVARVLEIPFFLSEVEGGEPGEEDLNEQTLMAPAFSFWTGDSTPVPRWGINE